MTTPVRDHELEPWRGFMLLRSGGYVDPATITAADVTLIDLAWAQGHLCRFTGHSDRFYSVAEHATLVGDLMRFRGGDDALVLAALVHDAAEAYLGDVGRPVKKRLGSFYPECEERISAVVDEFFGIELPGDGQQVALKDCDNAICGLELHTFWPGHPVLTKTGRAESAAGLAVVGHPPRVAALNWLIRLKSVLPPARIDEWTAAMESVYSPFPYPVPPVVVTL